MDLGPVDQKNQSMPVAITRSHSDPVPCRIPFVLNTIGEHISLRDWSDLSI